MNRVVIEVARKLTCFVMRLTYQYCWWLCHKQLGCYHSTCPCDWHCAYPLYWSPITPPVPVMGTVLTPSTGPSSLHLSLWWALCLHPLLIPHHSTCPCDGHCAYPLYWSPITPPVPVMGTVLTPSTDPPSLHLSLWWALCLPHLLVPHHSTCPCDGHCAYPLYWSPITPPAPVMGTVLTPSTGPPSLHLSLWWALCLPPLLVPHHSTCPVMGTVLTPFTGPPSLHLSLWWALCLPPLLVPHHSTCSCDGHCAYPLYWSPITPPAPVMGTVLTPSTGPPSLHLSLWWALCFPPLLVPHHSTCPCDGHCACPLYWSPTTPPVPVMGIMLAPSNGPPPLYLSLWQALCLPLYWSPTTPSGLVVGPVLAHPSPTPPLVPSPIWWVSARKM